MLEFGPLASGPGHDGLDSGNLGSAGDGWEESIDLDWLTGHEVRYMLPPTHRTRYQTKVFQQSVTILIKLQQNTTGGRGSSSAVAERGVSVGPWRVPEEQMPVLVGTITGASLLVLLLLSLLLYTCRHHNPTHKKYSVKSEVSSVTSGRTQGSAPSLSRDSLVVVTHASSGHQACLLSERGSPSEYLCECSCCSDPPSDLACSCGCPGEHGGNNDHAPGKDDGHRSPNGDDDDLLPRSLSMPLKEEAKLGNDDSQQETINNNNSVRSKVGPRPTSNPVAFSPCDLTLPRPTRRDSGLCGETRLRTLEAGCLPLSPESRLDEQSASSSVLDTVFPGARGGELEAAAADEAFRTRSLPAWVRNKTRPLTALDDLNTIYEKPNWSKRRRNRMRSDAAAVIALSKSRGRLLSPNPQASGQAAAAAALPDTAALVENEAVIVYDERTAL
ncbi:uncharacterized protein [Procambarus clarkii]|uniref:uncharacterized protein isoform X2 n=1 Tax=Procambarus clarkii TaxID=6728 RepID=UPI0037439EC7